MNKTKDLLIILFFLSSFLNAKAQLKEGDTLVVHAITFADPSPEGWGAQYKTTVQFPDVNESWAKIEMVQWLKCDS